MNWENPVKSPIFTQELYETSVNESTPVNSTIITVEETDGDEGINAKNAYTFTKTSESTHYTGMFTMNSTNGEIKINDKLDFEKNKNYELSIQAKDSRGLVAHAKVFIVYFYFWRLWTRTVISIIRVHDQVSRENGEVECQITEKVPFKLMPLSIRFFKIVTTKPMDREKISSYNIFIIATDR